MKNRIADYLSDLKLGELQSFRNLGVIPLLTSRNGGADYVLMREALERNFIEITEVDSQGSVPELKVINASDEFILLLDGEEVIGAKQNRVLNASILLEPRSETTLPVSCTEQGRWSSVSHKFQHSGEMMAAGPRSRKMRSVRHSLSVGEGHRSDQGQVWDDISHMAKLARASSRTGAMKDVYEAKQKDLESYLEAFTIVPGQKGSLVLINGTAVGLDVLSRHDTYGAIHPQLVRSYAMDALLQQEKDIEPAAVGDAWAFLGEAKACEETVHKSVGVGEDHSLQHPDVVGSALVHGESIVHLALFRTERELEERRFASYRDRMRSRVRDAIS